MHSKKNARRGIQVILAAVLSVIALVAAGLAGSGPVMAAGQTTVTVDGTSRNLDGTNVRRLANYLVLYTEGVNAGKVYYWEHDQLACLSEIVDTVDDLFPWLEARAKAGNTLVM